MPHSVRHVLTDILETIARIRRKLSEVSFEDFASDWELQFIAQRAIEIISEASRRIPDDLKATEPTIPWKSIAGIGSILRHEYHTVSNKIVWDAVHSDLPDLEEAIRSIERRISE